ncbi:iron complex transport system permease protein [Paenibacillus algorifonticola]|uniref:Iron complex transport system permease protein n=1 Tax=Paenibacillus algorifonticola TaxID=684063 RepID=A0A1I2IU41_9BACL|nr:iron ABC transporter permease [Paenibacillus algorifonticola]SFF45895.1 iron complex transport system permease protein [Paenibacillus algorifonticola]
MSLKQEQKQELKQMRQRSRPLVASIILIVGTAAVLFGLALSISVGAAKISLSTVWTAVFYFNPDITQHQIIQELRMPRALAAALIGAAFAVSGSVMQGMTRNPLADPSLLGLNAGAGFALALCFAFFRGMSHLEIMIICFFGAALAAGIVYGIGSLAKGGLTPVRLTLAGAAISTLFMSLSEGIQIHFQIGQDIAFWYAGGIAGTKWSQIGIVAPWIIGGILAAIAISRSISLLSLGDDVAVSLGQRTKLTKTIGIIVTLILAGASVSVVGAVGFIGLIVPHVARYLVGVDYRWIIPCSAVLGALLLIVADIVARTINSPYETPVGALIAIIGVPFFLYLAIKQRGSL